MKSLNRRTDNTMAKRKGTKGQTTIYKTLHIKLRSSNKNPPLIICIVSY